MKMKKETFILSRDGKEVLRGEEIDLWEYIHKNHPYSVSHALKHKGYEIEPEGEEK
jgi:hypothetical protein